MKKTIAFSLITGAILFSGCAGVSSGISVEKAKKEGGVREYVASKYRIFADRDDKTLFYTYDFSGGNPPPIEFYYLVKVRDMLKEYCEKGIGGKWKDGKRYYMFAKYDAFSFRVFELPNNPPNIDGIGVCVAPNGKGFKVKELGLFSFKVDWEIPKSLGGGERVSWRRYYEIEYDTPNKPKKDYVTYSFKSYFGKDYGNIRKLIKDFDGITNYGQGAQNLLSTHPLCKTGGGKTYIATDAGTDMKKVEMQDYLFKRYEYLYEKYKDKKEYLYHQYLMFPIEEKGYIWCKNSSNPNKEFMLIWDNKKKEFNSISGVKKEIVDNLEEDKNFDPKYSYGYDEITDTKFNLRVDDRNAYDIAVNMFKLKGNINVSNNPYVKYYGVYIGKIGDCEYASVEKKSRSLNKIYNFKYCGNEIKYTGKTLKGLAQNEHKKIKYHLNGLKRNCAIDGVALMQVDGYNLYCRSNKNGGFKIFILNDKYQLRDVLK